LITSARKAGELETRAGATVETDLEDIRTYRLRCGISRHNRTYIDNIVNASNWYSVFNVGMNRFWYGQFNKGIIHENGIYVKHLYAYTLCFATLLSRAKIRPNSKKGPRCRFHPKILCKSYIILDNF
jgi:hypothetical protein